MSTPDSSVEQTDDQERGDLIELNVISKPGYELEDEQERMLDMYNATSQMDQEFYQQQEALKHESLKSRLQTRIPYYFPVIGWLPEYSWKQDFAKDVVAGLGTAAMLIPQALAYALLAGLPPHIGLYTAFFPVVMYFFFGTSKQLSIGPDALSSLLCGILLIGRADEPVNVVAALTFMAGIVLFSLGILRVGFLDNVLSRPLLAGFVNAVALTIIFYQLDPLFGLSHANHGWEKVVTLIEDFGESNWPSFFIGAVTMVILLINKIANTKLAALKYVPDTLVMVILGIVLNYAIDFEKWGVKALGAMRQGFEAPKVPPFEQLERNNGYLMSSGLLISVIGFIEHIVVAKLYATKYNYQISPNRELVALGVSNLVGSFFHTYPTFGSLPRSGVADSLGARSQMFSLVSAIIIAITVNFLGPVFAFLPRVVMSGIIVVASIGLFEVRDVIFCWKVKAYRDIFLFAVTFLLTVGLGIEIGIGISLGISLFLIVKQSTYPFVTILGQVPGTESYHEVSSVDAVYLPGIAIVRIEEPLYFANIAQIKRLFSRIEKVGDPKAHPGERRKQTAKTKAIIIHARNVISMDASSMQTIAEMVEDYEKRNIRICWVKLRDHLRKPFDSAGIIHKGRESEQIFASTHEAVRFIQSQDDGPVRLQQMDESVVDPTVFEEEDDQAFGEPAKQGKMPPKEPATHHQQGGGYYTATDDLA